jgi:hypothetical protein
MDLALLWQIFSGTGFPNQFFNDSWVELSIRGSTDRYFGRRLPCATLDRLNAFGGAVARLAKMQGLPCALASTFGEANK